MVSGGGERACSVTPGLSLRLFYGILGPSCVLMPLVLRKILIKNGGKKGKYSEWDDKYILMKTWTKCEVPICILFKVLLLMLQ